MNDLLKWADELGLFLAFAAVVGIMWRAMRALVKTEEAVQDVPKLRKDFEELKQEVRAEVKTETSRLEAKMETQFAVMEKDNTERAERIQTQVDGQFNLLNVGLASMRETLAVIANDVGWIKRKNGHSEREERGAR
jgi:predicted amino acid-binding ACT domain protein